MEERICKGIFIPIEIWKNKDLSWNEKILFLEIDSFTSRDKECFVSNEYIADLLQVNETTANKVLSSLIKKGYVIKTRFDGRRRFVKTAFAFDKYQEAKQGCANAQGSLALFDNIHNTDTNTNNIKEIEDKSSIKKSSQDDSWRTSFDDYLALVNKAKEELLDDDEFYEKMNVYYPNADYDKTIDKMVSMFWGTEAGWHNKKLKRSKKINMLSTLKTNYAKNIVYKERGQVGRVRLETESTSSSSFIVDSKWQF